MDIQEYLRQTAEIWDSRYKQEEYIFGEEPNQFLKEELLKLSPGNILFPAEGEGRNAVFAAKVGWKVYAFDISKEGRDKALKLAKKNKLDIDYQLGDFNSLKYQENFFDVIALIYTHFPPFIRSLYFPIFDELLKDKGIIIAEVFSKRHIEYQKKYEKIGGPRDMDLLYSINDFQNFFPKYEYHLLEETEVELYEGQGHLGVGSVIRFVGKKI